MITRLLLMLILPYCHKADYKLYSNIHLHPTNRKGSFASKKTIEGLLYEIWNSGFMKKNNHTQTIQKVLSGSPIRCGFKQGSLFPLLQPCMWHHFVDMKNVLYCCLNLERNSTSEISKVKPRWKSHPKPAIKRSLICFAVRLFP